MLAFVVLWIAGTDGDRVTSMRRLTATLGSRHCSTQQERP